MALSLCFHSHSETGFHLHDRRRELEDRVQACLVLRVTSMAVSLWFNTLMGNRVYIHGS